VQDTRWQEKREQLAYLRQPAGGGGNGRVGLGRLEEGQAEATGETREIVGDNVFRSAISF
jgi:hypothetical protein